MSKFIDRKGNEINFNPFDKLLDRTEIMTVNESQLLLNLKAEFIESDVSQLKDTPIGESIAANSSFKIMLKQDSES